MGTDDIFKKHRQQRQQRKKEYLRPRVNSFLIVTEGTRTEPYYFQGIQQLIDKEIGGVVDIVAAPQIDIVGKGMSTMRLIEAADEIVKKAKIIYQYVWIVFDKDDFTDFDCAIKEGEKRGYNMAWTNQAFEYWIYLHFAYSDSALHRDEWCSKLDDLFKRYKLCECKYQKNYKELFQILYALGGPEMAIKNAKRRMNKFEQGKIKPSENDPGTTVHKLTEKLLDYLEE